MMIWALVLAAGESKRMGKPKQLLPYSRSTVLETVVENALASSVDRTLVVLGATSERIKPLLEKYPVRVTVNPEFRQGMLSSVQWGFRQLPADARAVLILLGDQPAVSTSTIERVIKAYKTSGRGLVYPSHKNIGGHPLLIDLKYRDLVNTLNPDVGLKQILVLHPEDTLRLSIGDPSAVQDMDTPEDYTRLLEDERNRRG